MTRDLVPDVLAADYTGRPGQRTFFIQARGPGESLTYLLEKAQLALLAEKVQELLLEIDHEDTIRGATPARDPALALQDPLDAEWRVGAIGLGFDDANDRIVILLRPSSDVDETDELMEETGDRIFVRRDQARAFALHVTAVVAEGRPTCPMCGLPMDPEGHRCPAVNGHHPAE